MRNTLSAMNSGTLTYSDLIIIGIGGFIIAMLGLSLTGSDIPKKISNHIANVIRRFIEGIIAITSDTDSTENKKNQEIDISGDVKRSDIGSSNRNSHNVNGNTINGNNYNGSDNCGDNRENGNTTYNITHNIHYHYDSSPPKENKVTSNTTPTANSDAADANSDIDENNVFSVYIDIGQPTYTNNEWWIKAP